MVRRVRQLKSDDRGFTLVEMVIAFAILAVVILMVSMIIRASGSTYRTVSTDINLQYESQLAMNQLQEYVIDCNAAVGTGSDGTLYVFDKTGGNTYTGYQFKQDGGVLYLNSKTISTDDFQNEPGKFTFDPADREPMSDYIAGFAAEATTQTDPKDAAIQRVASVRLRLFYKSGGQTYQGEQIVALRNPAVFIDGAP